MAQIPEIVTREKVAPGNGSLKYWTYWSPGIGTLRTMEGVRDCVNRGFTVYRKEKVA